MADRTDTITGASAAELDRFAALGWDEERLGGDGKPTPVSLSGPQPRLVIRAERV